MADDTKDKDIISNISSMNESLTKIYDSLIKGPIDDDAKTVANSPEIVDIVRNYSWSRNAIKSSSVGGTLSTVPLCFVVERRLSVSSSIANLINGFATIDIVTKKLSSSGDKLTSLLAESVIGEKVGNLLNVAANTVSDNKDENKNNLANQSNGSNALIKLGTSLATSLSNTKNMLTKSIDDKIGRGNCEEKLLNPYRWLYFTEPTDKRYTFPALNDSAASLELTNNFGNAETGSVSGALSGNTFTDLIENSISGWNALATDVSNIIEFLASSNGLGTFLTNFIEKAKYYNVPSESSITITFPLYNTVIRNSWLKNYKFLFRFCLRNMMFKVDTMTYKQPLLYDLFIPGVKRMPLCYVADIKVTPHGIIRPLVINNLIDSNTLAETGISGADRLTVNVPEAWLVKITFKSLIADSANQMLSALSNPITVSSTKSN